MSRGVFERARGVGRWVAGVAIVSSACTLDSTNPTGTGAGGANASSSSSSSSSPSSTGVTQPTTGASTTDGSSTASGTGGMGTTSSTSASSSSASTASASSSSGGATNLPFCATTGAVSEADDFNSYIVDATFIALGEGAGPWSEGQPSNDVMWSQNQIVTTNGFSFLARKTPVTLPGANPACAITVKLVSLDGGNARFGLIENKMPPSDPNASAVVIEENTGMGYLHPFGYSYLGGPVTFPVTLGVVVTAGHLHAFFLNGSTWTPLLSMTGGAPVGWLATSSGYIRFGQRDGSGDTSRWDDYDVVPIPSTVPL